MDRRQFVVSASAAAAVLAVAPSGCTRAALPPFRLRRAPVPERASLNLADVIPATPILEQQFRELLQWMHSAGWLALITEMTGLALDPSVDDGVLFREIAVSATGGFSEFGGRRLIQPGDPAMSLLYHTLASPFVRLAEATDASRYPPLEQLDVLENYIYGRHCLSEEDMPAGCVLAVFAYEYRPRLGTPHEKHSDLVFSRTGIARVGTEPPQYSPPDRSFLNQPRDAGSRGTAVTPARYALFLAEPVHVSRVSQAAANYEDSDLAFLLPIRKLSSHDPYVAGRGITFLESHRNEKLRRLALHPDICLPEYAGFDESRAPFVRQSASTTLVPFPAHSPEFDATMVSLSVRGASVLLSPQPGPLVRDARQDGQRLRFRVPPKKTPLGRKDLSNRRYTTLKLLANTRDALREAQDFFNADVLLRWFGWRRTGLRAPRNAPVFVNIRHEVDENGAFVRHLDRDTPDFEKTISEGQYWAAMFEDGLCDGCIDARLDHSAMKTSEPVDAYVSSRLASLAILPAFSVVAAPDILPYVEPGDFNKHDVHFLEGGPELVSAGRVRANPHISRPWNNNTAAFPTRPSNDTEASVARTITATVSMPAQEDAGTTETQRAWRQTSTLPDNASNVFAPGWELTFGRDGSSLPFLQTFGLGSPFPEDMKLCAVANGMWPGSSPDASRTFFGDLAPVISPALLRKPPTAVPLLDTELGIHGGSPAALQYEQSPKAGWDGECGPFLEVTAGPTGNLKLKVNFADVRNSDYVQHAMCGDFDLSILRDLSHTELIARMDTLRWAVWAITNTQPRYSTLWVVSAERVPDWARGALGYGVPKELFRPRHNHATTANGVTGHGMLYVFAQPAGTSEAIADMPGRRRMDTDSVFICQATARRAAWVQVTPSGTIPQHAEWRWR